MFTSKYISELDQEFENLASEYYQNPEVDYAKDRALKLIGELNESIAIRKQRINKSKSAGAVVKSDALALVSMRDSGMIESVIKKAIEDNEFGKVFEITQLVENSDTFSQADRFKAKRYREDVEKKTGIYQEGVWLDETKILNTKINSFYDNVGTMDNDKLKSKVNDDRASVEGALTFQRCKDEHRH